MLEPFRIGFLPLVDAALPILALELGFAAKEGIALKLIRDLSWATVRDRLIYGHSDAAHMVAPLAIATTLGLDSPAVSLSAPFVLGLNGNAITLSPSLATAINGDVQTLADPLEAGRRFAAILAARAKEGRKVRIGVVHRYSSHHYILRYWLAASGADVERDVDIVTIAPPASAEALAIGEVDGICVGEPWNSVAVDQGVGTIVVVTAHIWRRGVEKVLAMPTERMERQPDLVHRVIRALYNAGKAFIQPERLDEIAEIMARPEYLGGSAMLIKRAISDRIQLTAGAEPIHIPDFMFQHWEAANFPWASQAAWLYAQMVRAGHAANCPQDYAAAQRVFRPDTYRAAFAKSDVPLPGASAKLEGAIGNATGVGTVQGRLVLGSDRFFDGKSFDPEQLDAHLQRRRANPNA